jgi:2-dehydropantoate 2-reductase
MAAAGLNPQIVPDIRAWIWAKIISSLCWNPVAALTGATLAEMNAQPAVVAIVRRMMAEADALAARVGVPRLPLSIDERIAAARNAGAHKMSMQDLERGRPLEIDALIDSLLSMRDLAPSPTPTIDDLYALLRLRAVGLRG